MNRSLGLRIMMTTDAVGGVWTYATGLSAALTERGADVALVTMGPAPRADQRAIVHERVSLIETDLALEWQDPEADNIGQARRTLRELESRLRPDVVHLNSYREATFGWIAPVLVTAHSCVTTWAHACNDCDWLSSPQWQRYGELVAAGLEAAAAWVCPSAAHGHLVEQIYRPSRSGRVVWNGIPAALQPEQKLELILAAGRMWDKAKGLATLAKAAGQINWPVLVAGDAPPQGSTSLQSVGNLPQADLHQLMRRAAIFVSPALYEPFGLAVLEAASAGCALVLADIPSFRELWNDAALFVPAGDVDRWAEALNLLVWNGPHRAALQGAAFERSHTYALTHTTDNYLQLYAELTSADRGQPMGAVA